MIFISMHCNFLDSYFSSCILELFKSKCWRDGLFLIADAIATAAPSAISLQEIFKCVNIDSFITLEVIFIRRSPDNLQFDIYHFSVGVQRRRSVFNSHIARGNIMGKRFANDFDTQPVQRIDAL